MRMKYGINTQLQSSYQISPTSYIIPLLIHGGQGAVVKIVGVVDVAVTGVVAGAGVVPVGVVFRVDLVVGAGVVSGVVNGLIFGVVLRVESTLVGVGRVFVVSRVVVLGFGFVGIISVVGFVLVVGVVTVVGLVFVVSIVLVGGFVIVVSNGVVTGAVARVVGGLVLVVVKYCVDVFVGREVVVFGKVLADVLTVLE